MTSILFRLHRKSAGLLVAWVGTCAVASLLVACGGGGSDIHQASGPASARTAASTDMGAAPIDASEKYLASARTRALQEEGAVLNTAELALIAKTGVLPQPFDGPLLGGEEFSQRTTPGESKSAVSRVPVYRFFNAGTGAHFFTISTSERDNIITTLPAFSFEGPAFYTSNAVIAGLSPVHRFFNTATGVHFYTISESERASIVASLPQFSYEGIAYYASTLPGTGYTPLYRFFYAARGFHFYTNSLAERDNIIATLPQYRYEGIGYHVLGGDWQTPAVPHTGIGATQCHQAGSDVLVTCGSVGANSLNSQQDGHRTAINTMGYSLVAGHGLTECVRDNVTGLVWESKTSSGARSAFDTYRNVGDGLAGDASDYVNTVNGMSLCGFNDWRLPQVHELQGLIVHGLSSGALLNSLYFLNRVGLPYWSAESYLGVPNNKWTVNFGTGFLSFMGMNNFALVRLVRGPVWTGQRYLIVSASHDGDGVNNAVLDRKTGLIWRRCLEGQFWVGSNCVGLDTKFNHQQALTRATSQSGWRLPNVKELASLSDLGREIPALDHVALPGQGGGLDTWSSTPSTTGSPTAWYVAFNNGFTGKLDRTSNLAVQLVRDGP